jgi:hypothetical protein
MTVVKSSPDQRTASHNYAVFLTTAMVFRNSVIDVVDYYDVFVCRACIASSVRRRRSRASSRTPIRHSDRAGEMKMVLLFDGRAFGELNFEGRAVRMRLVTEVGLDLHVATVYGKVLKTIERALTFRIVNGNDLVAFVLHLEVMGSTKEETVALEYLKGHQVILLIGRNGMISRVQFPVFGESGQSGKLSMLCVGFH